MQQHGEKNVLSTKHDVMTLCLTSSFTTAETFEFLPLKLYLILLVASYLCIYTSPVLYTNQLPLFGHKIAKGE